MELLNDLNEVLFHVARGSQLTDIVQLVKLSFTTFLVFHSVKTTLKKL